MLVVCAHHRDNRVLLPSGLGTADSSHCSEGTTKSLGISFQPFADQNSIPAHCLSASQKEVKS